MCLSSTGGDGYTLIAALDSTASEVRRLDETIRIAYPTYAEGFPADDSAYVEICIFDVDNENVPRNTVAAWVSNDPTDGGVRMFALWDRVVQPPTDR